MKAQDDDLIRIWRYAVIATGLLLAYMVTIKAIH
jgi:hypothetical protein